jgi:threonine/homoserine/homoserine lactone efflux protein
MTHLAAFVTVALVVIMMPGPDTALTIRNTLGSGRRGGIFTALGVATGPATWALATSVGLAALLAACSQVFAGIRVLGAIYLVGLGVQALRAALRHASNGDATRAGHGCRFPVTSGTAWRQGLASNLLNPKMVAFFPSLLPQFARDVDGGLGTLLVLGLAFSVMTLGWLTAYAAALAKLGWLVDRSGLRRVLEGLMGALLIGFGVRLALERR